MKHISFLLSVALLFAVSVFAQQPDSAIDSKVSGNKMFTATVSVTLLPTSNALYRIQPTERLFMGGVAYCPSTSGFFTATFHPSFVANGVTNITNISNYHSYSNAPAEVIAVINNNEGGLRVNELLSVTKITNAGIVLNTTNISVYPCRTAVVGNLFLNPQYLINTRTYILSISNTSLITNAYIVKLLFWKP